MELREKLIAERGESFAISTLHAFYRRHEVTFKKGSIRESYASPCYGGGEAGPVIGAGGKADEVEPAQVVVQIAGGDAAAGT